MESDAGVEVNRAMKAHEMFARVLKKKALPLVEGGCAWLRDHRPEEHRGPIWAGYCVLRRASTRTKTGILARVTANGLYR